MTTLTQNLEDLILELAINIQNYPNENKDTIIALAQELDEKNSIRSKTTT